MADIYDGVFRTIINDCRQFLIPLINEIFSEKYTGEEEIEFYPNEHFLDQQDEADTKRITDSCFRIIGNTTKKYHMECESSLPDGRITVRLFEYDAQIALDSGEIGAFDKRTIIELSRDVIKEITQKYKKVQERVGGIMNGVLIETETKKILNQGINETKKKMAASMLKDGILSVSKIAEYSGLEIDEVQSLKI